MTTKVTVKIKIKIYIMKTEFNKQEHNTVKLTASKNKNKILSFFFSFFLPFM